MRKIKIITDSTAGLTQEEAAKWNIDILYLTVEIDGKVYNPKTDITPEGFMDRMAETKELPKSSQPAIGSFVEAYEKYTAEGYEILSIHLTEKLSGTVNAARQAADMVEGNITVVDSDYTARGQAFQVLAAAEMAQNGDFSVEEIHAKINDIRDKTKLYIVVVTLDNLIKGGRVGRMQGFLGSLLNIKLIAKLTDGQLEEETKVRSNKKVLQYCLNLVKDEPKKIQHLDVVHANGLNLADEFISETKEIKGLIEIPLFFADPVISTHAGAGAFAFMYYTD
ncbi:DegV family protein [Listeria seeligeri]|uniref:DegV family protein n=1 Tax=Listeria seeligeri TaxID=1640 RepID=UPI001623B7B2|nr:DegV family protein [Listeria seeligeri]MBC1584882.1 DegV family protein [Listeria seeligeri]MBC1598593.1 DegV family protein [Listeria seeligeri]MBC1990097.1 DegV family protein [Listeria seeligeri]MBC2247512.1 DegV family protein [Listeria seeligeri]MBF2376792.1 DegV family protein [Listeria seeligeri]